MPHVQTAAGVFRAIRVATLLWCFPLFPSLSVETLKRDIARVARAERAGFSLACSPNVRLGRQRRQTAFVAVFAAVGAPPRGL
jgi:hypothetical protein